MKGSYILLMELDKDSTIKVGKLGKIHFKKGFYAYVGSALNGLEQRIERHKRSNKKLHWHIDYFLKYAKIIDIFYRESEEKEECEIANKFEKLDVITDFGCSDCKCKSHLFYGSNKDILQIIDSTDMQNT